MSQKKESKKRIKPKGRKRKKVEKKKSRPANDDNRRNRQKQKNKKLLVAGCWGNNNFVQNTLPHFNLNFLSILERLSFGGSREKTPGAHQFSLLLTLPTNHPSHPFSLLFSTFFFHPPQNHPNQTYPYS